MTCINLECGGSERETILIVDDDAFNRELLGELVDFLGYSPLFAASGREGLERLTPDISVVLLDVMMPEMDGFEVTRRIRAHASCADTPVILVTALTNRDDKLRGVEVGASDFITKPIDPTELRVRLNAQVKTKRAKDALAAAREQEVAVAAEIQSTLLLGRPPTDIPNVSIAAFTASSDRIDGDFYHFFVYDDRHFDIAVGDVMGKGIPAAVLGAATKSAIQQAISREVVESPESFPAPQGIVGRVHRDMTPHLIRLDTFVTLAYAHVDLERECLILVDCGHTSAVNYRTADRRCELVRGDNLPLGVMDDETHKSTEIAFSQGDIFVLYSDGVTEAENPAGEMYGVSRLADVIAKHHAGSSDSIVKAVRSAVQEFTGTTAILDDFTCVVLKIGEPVSESDDTAILETLSDLENLAEIGVFVRGFFARSPHLAERDIDALELIVNEAVVNVIDHGYGGETGRPIEIHLGMTPDAASVRIYDWASPFDPSTARPPTLDGSRSDGFGLFIIEQNTTTAAYERDLNGRNCSTFIRQTRFHQETPSCN